MYNEQENMMNTSIAKIKVIGVGGGGCNAVQRMINYNFQGPEFIAVNTDKQALITNPATKRIQIGIKLTKGLGAGADPDVGQKAAEESKQQIIEALQGSDLVFITAGMGGGTGTGAAAVVAQAAKELGILTIAVVTKPFPFEGHIRAQNAEKGIANLKKYVDTLVIIPNEKLLKVMPKGTSFLDSFKYADEVLRQGIQGITDLIINPGVINLDFADVKTIMKNKGYAHMGIGVGKGENKVQEAVRNAVYSPLLETQIEGATGVLLNVKGGLDMALDEVNEASELVREVVDPSCNIIFGTSINHKMTDSVEVTIIATGFNGGKFADEKPKQDQRAGFGNFAGIRTNEPNIPHNLFGGQAEINNRNQNAPHGPTFAQQNAYQNHNVNNNNYQNQNGYPNQNTYQQPNRAPIDNGDNSRMYVDEIDDIPPFLKKMKNR